MNKQQKKELVHILARDCACAGTNIQDNMTCAIGAMVIATVSPRTKVYKAMVDDPENPVGESPAVEQHLCKRFGLTEEQLTLIQRLNDAVKNEYLWPYYANSRKNILRRRKKVLTYVRSLPVTKE